jgi:hypothetical protein
MDSKIATASETVSGPWTNRRIREVEGEVCGLAGSLQERQRRYERSCEKLAGVRDISRTLAKCHMLLNEVSYFMMSCQQCHALRLWFHSILFVVAIASRI